MTASDRESLGIGPWVTRNPATVQCCENVTAAVRIMARLRIGAVLVMDGQELVGIFTERDLVKIMDGDPVKPMDRTLGEVMTPHPVCVEIGEDFNGVYEKMTSHSIRHLPILEDGKLTGIVSIRDLARYYQNRLEAECSEARRQVEELERLTGIALDERMKSLVAEIGRYKELAVTDPLTGLYNKRYFLTRLSEEVERANRYEQDLSMLFCDVDHFKKVNDDYGHAFGDEVLKRMAGLFSCGMDRLHVVSRLRKSDIVARYGGEEFVTILPETDLAGAVRAAEKVRGIVEKTGFEADGKAIRITISFGAAQYVPSLANGDGLIRAADAALYRAKQNGRNRVEAAVPGEGPSR